MNKLLRININSIISHNPFRGITENDIYGLYKQVHIFGKINSKFNNNNPIFVKGLKFYNAEHLFIDIMHTKIMSQFEKQITFPHLQKIFVPDTNCNMMLLHPGDVNLEKNKINMSLINYKFSQGRTDVIILTQKNYYELVN